MPPPVGFEPTMPAGERPQTHALDRAATGTGLTDNYELQTKSQLLTEFTSIWLHDLRIC